MIILVVNLLLVLVSLGHCDEIREPERHKVVIVGAGVSGISAAATLLELTSITDVIVLEASDRIGGRIHTVEYGGIFLDKGAEFVQGDVNNSVYEIVKAHDLLVSYEKTFLQPEKVYFTDTAGNEFNSTYVNELLDKAYSTLNDLKIKSPNTSVADYFSLKLDELFHNKNIDSKLEEAIRNVVEGRICVYNAVDSLNDIGSSTEFNEENDGDMTLKWKPGAGGYKILFDFLMKKFPNAKEELPVVNKTLFNKQVTQIKYGEGKPVEVKCADGSSYLADHVIMTVSLGVLKKHADTIFTPPLPQRKTDTIQALGFGVIGKIFVLYPTRWWPKDINLLIPLLSNQEVEEMKNTTTHGYWMVESLGFHPVLGNDRMLELWLGGESCRAMESLTEEQVMEGVIEYTEKFLGKKFNISRPESILRTSWASNPFTLGSYSFHSVDSDRQNLTNSDLAAPVLDNDKPVLLFAGEATINVNYGTVNGALDTGHREAHNLIKYLKNN